MWHVAQQYVLNGPESLSLDPKRHVEVGTTDIVSNTVAKTLGAIGYVDIGTATRQNLHTVLIDNVAASPRNVKNGSYTFWNVEHLYTRGIPTGLTKSFIEYMNSDTIKRVISNRSYIPLDDVPHTTKQAHPNIIAPEDHQSGK